jgi:hypothetical protein
LSDAYVDWLEITLAMRSAEIFDHSGLSMMCAVLLLILEWATDHRDELMEDWNLCSQLKPPRPIDSLT